MHAVLTKTFLRSASLGALLTSFVAGAQVVDVTVSLDATNIPSGSSTTLRVFAQVIPAQRANAERIFSWYVDVLNTNGSVAGANYDAMLKSASDNDPETSSTGTDDGANRRGIYDTFMNLPGAGTSNAVELMAIPVAGLLPGTTRFSVQAGTGVPLSADFLVHPKDDGDPLVGGIYTLAQIDLQVTPCQIALHIDRQGDGTPGKPLLLSFTPCVGLNHTVEFRDALGSGPGWQALPGAPHNSGTVTVTNSVSQRFFRVQAVSP